MQVFGYPAVFEKGDGPDVVVVSFPDVPEAIAEGADMAEGRRMAADALGLVLLHYLRLGRALPRARARAKDQIAVEPEVAAKLAVLMAFKQSGLTQRELAKRLGKDEKEVRRILDPMHPTKIGALSDALAVLGHRLVIGMEKLPDVAA
ncbi:MAG: type II toxin-antitoxin system HicB family antitoxin [Bauldia sp.]|nr:type II toxin-antitoxin system HicB family antitoxin [Bauldia sp.]